MNLLARALFPSAALVAGITLLCGACSTASHGTAATASPAATATASSAPVTATSSAPATVAAAPVVYLAEGGSVTGTFVHAPSCRPDCALSGDSTASLSGMAWSTWNATEAVGTGTEQLDDCDPNCAAGTLHAIPVRVTLSKPVTICVAGKGKLFWTQVTFRWPDGLPAAFAGGNAPANPLDYAGLTSEAAKTCP
jgi:hypothetical protein